ncbi:MAG: hypothetical protein QM754_09190 [Tepidisphaeraceae bacterium]
MIEHLFHLTLSQVIAGALAVNIGMFIVTLIVGHFLVQRFSGNRVTAEPDPVEAAEIWLACSCVVLNSLVAVSGWLLWRQGWIVLREELSCAWCSMP